MKVYKCSRGAGCELWEDDEMLLEEDQRQGRVNVREPVAQEAIAPPTPLFGAVAPAQYQEYHTTGDFEWIHEGKLYVQICPNS